MAKISALLEIKPVTACDNARYLLEVQVAARKFHST